MRLKQVNMLKDMIIAMEDNTTADFSHFYKEFQDSSAVFKEGEHVDLGEVYQYMLESIHEAMKDLLPNSQVYTSN